MSSGLPPEKIDLIAAKMAELQLAGVGINKQVQLINQEFGTSINNRTITRYRKREVYTRILDEYTNNIVKNAVSNLKREVSDLIPLVTSALRKALEDGNINAIPHVLKVIGIDSEVKEQQAQQLTVVLPGATQAQIRDIDETDKQ